MKTILHNGIIKDIPYILDDNDEFGIQFSDNKTVDNVFYQGDDINYTLDSALVELYDLFRDRLFEDIDQYYEELELLPICVQEAGQSSESTVSAEDFNEWIETVDIPNFYKHLYLVDCQFLVGTIQNLLCAMETAFITFYETLTSFEVDELHKRLVEGNGTIEHIGKCATQAANAVETYFTKAYSILDIMCKICYELQFLHTDFDIYQKLKCSGKIWGARKVLRINNTGGTVFEKCDFIASIEAIRNEIVHNGTWELNPRIFIKLVNNVEVERFMFYPDMEQGHLTTVKNRRHFFSSDVKINNILPEIHLEIKQRLLATIHEIQRIYA